MLSGRTSPVTMWFLRASPSCLFWLPHIIHLRVQIHPTPERTSQEQHCYYLLHVYLLVQHVDVRYGASHHAHLIRPRSGLAILPVKQPLSSCPSTPLSISSSTMTSTTTGNPPCPLSAFRTRTSKSFKPMLPVPCYLAPFVHHPSQGSFETSASSIKSRSAISQITDVKPRRFDAFAVCARYF